MARDDRFYAFFVAIPSRSRSQIRRITLHKRWLRLSLVASVIILGAAVYGFYGLTQQVMHVQIERENARLKEENQKQRAQLNELNQRVEEVEDTSRRLAEISGVSIQQENQPKGKGGPALPIQDASAIVSRAERLQRGLMAVESIIRTRLITPSIWPVSGEMTDGFGGRRNPFGGVSSEFHPGQDIATIWGSPVEVTAAGTVTFAGWQNGYGNVVVVDHGRGLTTRYGHLSQIGVAEGQQVNRGDVIGNVGSTGRSTGPHLHYEVRINDEPVDPRSYLP